MIILLLKQFIFQQIFLRVATVVTKKLQTKVNELLKQGYKLNGQHTMKIITTVHDKDYYYCATQSLYK